MLRDGSTVHVRPALSSDAQALTDFFVGLSPRSRRFRFFTEWANLESFVDKALDSDRTSRLDLVALAGPKLVAHALYVRTEPGRAEVAFAVDDSFQGKGLGTIMLGQLAEAAHDADVSVFEATTLATNRQMVEVFRDSGFLSGEGTGTIRAFPDEVRVEFPTSMSLEARERFDSRDRTAAAAAVRSVLEPQTVAVVGASERPGSIGAAVLRNLMEAGFEGTIVPVNPAGGTVQGLEAVGDMSQVEVPVDLAVVAVPARAVPDVARSCANKGVRALVVISSGFAEVGADGVERQKELLEVCRNGGMRLVGPNCFGVLNTDPRVRLNATFGRKMPSPGGVGLLTQSGALGLAMIDYADATGMGVSSFVSNGNKADISGNDLLSYWEKDERTRVVLLYLESFGNPRKFARVARHVGRTKPIVAMKSGRSKAGARASSSHTGALLSASDVTVDALFRQSGVIRCDSMPELFDTARMLARQPVPSGNRVAIVTNAGGPGIMCSDVCEAEGLEVAELDPGVQEALREFLPPQASTSNPVDMIASAGGEDFRRAIVTIADSGAADAIIAIYIPPLVTSPDEIAKGIEAAAGHLEAMPRELPLAYVFMSPEPSLGAGRLAIFGYPEEAARAVARAFRYGVWRERPVASPRQFEDVDVQTGAAILATALGRTGDGWLRDAEVAGLFGAYGIRRPAERIARNAEEVASSAAEIGFPVALKAIGPGLLHKTELGAVVLGLKDAREVADAADRLTERLGAKGQVVEGLLVQQMADPGVEMLVGVVHDPLFGPVVALGAGGVAAEAMRDVQVRITPLTDTDTKEMIDQLRTAPMLRGFRGAPPVDVVALEEIVHRVGAMVEAHPEVAELDCNPVIVSPAGALVVDARVRVSLPELEAPIGAA